MEQITETISKSRLKKKAVFGFKNGTQFVIHEGYAWLLYRYYKNKACAAKVATTLTERLPVCEFKVFHTYYGIGVFSLPKEGYRISVDQIRQYT